MPKRLYVCDVVGNGTFFDPYRSAIDGAGRNVVALIPHTSSEDGRPLRNHCLVLVAATNAEHSIISAMSGVDPLPVIAMSTVLSAAQRNALITRLDNRNLPSGWVVPGITMRQVVRAIGRYYQNTFDEDRFDVADVN